MKTDVDIVNNNRQTVATAMAKVLTNETVLYIKTKNALWNTEGADIYDNHKIFKTQFRQLYEMIDSVVERIRFIGHYAPASLKSYRSSAELAEITKDENDGQRLIKELLADHENTIIALREQIISFINHTDDLGTNKFTMGLIETHEKMICLLRSQLK